MKVAIMQPYIFPYIGYFQLICSVDKFVFYDDVNFIKRGWINRNKILLNNQEKLITFPCIKLSQNKHINQVEVNMNHVGYYKVRQTIEHAYNKAPYYKEILPIIESFFNSKSLNIGDLAIESICLVKEYLGLNTQFSKSSIDFPDSIKMKKKERLISITKTLKSQNYINAIGGMSLYDKKDFIKEGISLSFLKPNLSKYNQFENNGFVSGLSIIDVMMFNCPETIKKMLTEYTLV